MKKIKKLEQIVDVEFLREIERNRDKINEIIDVLNSWVFEPTLTIPSQSQKQPEKCDCDYCKAYRFSMEKEPEEKLKKEDMLRWLRNGGILKVESEKQEEWREKIKQMVLTDCFKDQPDIQRYIDFIEQLLSESKEKAKIEVLEKVLEKKTNYSIEREEHGYRVTLEYVLADDIKKEIKLLKEKE